MGFDHALSRAPVARQKVVVTGPELRAVDSVVLHRSHVGAHPFSTLGAARPTVFLASAKSPNKSSLIDGHKLSSFTHWLPLFSPASGLFSLCKELHRGHGISIPAPQGVKPPLSTAPVPSHSGHSSSSGVCELTAPQPWHSVCVSAVSGPFHSTYPPQSEHVMVSVSFALVRRPRIFSWGWRCWRVEALA